MPDPSPLTQQEPTHSDACGEYCDHICSFCGEEVESVSDPMPAWTMDTEDGEEFDFYDEQNNVNYTLVEPRKAMFVRLSCGCYRGAPT